MSYVEQEAAILHNSGFARCEFGPDEMECESRNLPELQLYYRRTCYENDEGEYKCLCCIAVRKAENEAEGRFVELEMEKDAEAARLAKDLGEADALLAEAYGYTTAATNLLPERIKAFRARIGATEKKL